MHRWVLTDVCTDTVVTAHQLAETSLLKLNELGAAPPTDTDYCLSGVNKGVTSRVFGC